MYCIPLVESHWLGDCLFDFPINNQSIYISTISYATTPMKQINQILCPVDFSEASYHAIEQASFLAKMYQANLTLVHVVSNVLPESLGIVHGNDMESQKMVGQAEERARELLRAAKRKYVPFAITCKSSIRFGSIADSILAEANDRSSDLIVIARASMADDGRPSSLSRVLMERASCPVMAYCPNEQERVGFRRILIPLHPKMETSPLQHYVKDYLSQMMPEIHLVAMAEPQDSEAYKDTLKNFLKREKAFYDEIDLSVRLAVISGSSAVKEIDAYAHSQNCDLIMLEEHTIYTLSNILRTTSMPIILHRSLSYETATPATGGVQA